MLYGRIRRKHTEFQKLKADSQKKRNKLHNDRSGKAEKMDILTAKLSSLSYLEFSGSLTGDVETLTAALQPYLTVLCEQESSKMTAWTSFKDHLLRQLKENGILFKSSL